MTRKRREGRRRRRRDRRKWRIDETLITNGEEKYENEKIEERKA